MKFEAPDKAIGIAMDEEVELAAAMDDQDGARAFLQDSRAVKGDIVSCGFGRPH